MCGRFYINDRDPVLWRLYEQMRSRPGYELLHGGEIFPTDVIPVLVSENGKLVPRPMVWGLPKWDGKGVVINARAESVTERSLFRRAFFENPAIIPTSGFFEWKTPPQGGKKEKYLFTLPGAARVYLAGFWSRYDDADGPLPERVTILTIKATTGMAPYHHRMPLILLPDDLEDWAEGRGHGARFGLSQPEVQAEIQSEPGRPCPNESYSLF